MSTLTLLQVPLALLGIFAIARFSTLLLGVSISQLVAAVLVFGAANVWVHPMTMGDIFAAGAFVVGELLLAYFSALNLFRAPENPGHSLHSILTSNLADNVSKYLFVLLVAAFVCYKFIPFQDPDFQRRTESLAQPLVKYGFGCAGVILLAKGLSWIATANRLMRGGI